MAIPSIKCVVVGDDTAGKTSLLMSFTTNKSSAEYRPLAVFDSFRPMTFNLDGTQLSLELCDTLGLVVYDRLRPSTYLHTDVFIICFSLVDPNSYEHVRTKWAPELAFHRPTAPILVVGTKSDLREDPETLENLRDLNIPPIQYHQGLAMSKDIGADGYLECSAFTTLGVKTVFEQAMRFGRMCNSAS